MGRLRQDLVLCGAQQATPESFATLSRGHPQIFARGCVVARVDSHAFQAPDFYRKYGYEEVGFVDDAPIGYGEYFFAKRLDR